MLLSTSLSLLNLHEYSVDGQQTNYMLFMMPENYLTSIG
jgi:hypothetical protein